MNEHESTSENKGEKFRLAESSESFEDLLMTNNLFVDFFNMFLRNPALGEILRFNCLSGDLEVIEDEKQPPQTVRFANKPQRPKSIDKSQIIKKSIESQLKAIIKNQTPPPNIDPRLTYGNTQSRAFLSNSFHNMKDLESPSQYTKRQQELLSQVDNHSFKDLKLIEMKSNLNEVTNPLEKPVIPVINSVYCVKTLKKPYSMKWLNARRLSLFLESELYLEFKLATLLSQYDLNNNEQESVKVLRLYKIEVDPDLITDLNPFKSKTDLEKLQQYYDMSNEEKLKVTERINQRSAGSAGSRQLLENSMPKLTKEKTFLTSVSSPKSKRSITLKNTSDKTVEKKKPEPPKLPPKKPSILDDPNFETFKSIKDEKAKTRMVVINQEPDLADSIQLQKKKTTTGDSSNSKYLSSKKPILKKAKENSETATCSTVETNKDMTVKSVDDVAKILVNKIIEESRSQMNSPRVQKSTDLMNIEQNMKYEMSEKLGDTTGKRARSRSRNSDRAASATIRSSSQASYYKNYQTDLFDDDFTSDKDSIKTEDDVKVQLEDEPENVCRNKSNLADLRLEEIEEFKTYLKDNSAYLYYRMWVDIEKIQFYSEDSEKQAYIKQLKFTYNRPLVLNRLNIAETTIPTSSTDDSLVTKSKKRNYYNKLYEQYENNIDFWSLGNLKNNLQKSLLNTLITYWWPKYLMRMSDEYVKSKYPSYDIQRKMLTNHKSSPNDFNAKNIETTLKGVETLRNKAETNNFINPMTDSNQQLKISRDSNKKANSLNRMGAGSAASASRRQPLAKEGTNLSMKERKREAAAAAAVAAAAEAATTTKKEKKGPLKIPGLEMYELVEDFRTGPPVGWKRPASTTSLMVRKMLENRQNNLIDAHKRAASKINKLDKDFYFEAIYRDDYGGQIFMKYLKSKQKKFAINRLVCLKELMKYKDLFYDDNFNQEAVKLHALEIYKKHLAVSANYSIDCPKADRLKLYSLFADSFNSEQIGVGNFVSYFKPVYEDTFISIEEYLLVSLYDDWRAFIEIEESFYNNNEIENIERKINIRSKKIDELINQGLVKIAPTQSHVNFGPDLRKDRNENDMCKQEQHLLNSQWKMSRGSPNYSDLEHDNYHPPYSLKEVVANSNEHEMFKLFLQTNNAFFDILCWIDIEAYSQINPEDIERIESHAVMLKRKYINKKYFFSQTGPVDQYTQNIILEKIGGWSNVLHERPPNSLIYLVKKYLERKLVNYWLPLYYNSEYRAKALHQQRIQMNDVVNDVMFLKTNSQKIRQYSKIKRQRWLYSSQMVISFSKAVRSSFTSKLFHKFLSIKAFPNSSNPDTNSFDLEMENSNMINNLQFLIDIQAYKDKHQQNTDNKLDREILFKMNHIVETYLNNRILPRIRIDISDELAKEILYQKDYLSPYLFLEAYLIIFNVLMPFWVEFNSMRSEKDLDIFDDTSCFKKTKNEPRIYGHPTTGIMHSRGERHHQESMPMINDNSMKWRYNQYVKALKTQLVL